MGAYGTGFRIVGVVTLLFALLFRCRFVVGEAAHTALRPLGYQGRVAAGRVADAER
jgi:hypothetical protein